MPARSPQTRPAPLGEHPQQPATRATVPCMSVGAPVPKEEWVHHLFLIADPSFELLKLVRRATPSPDAHTVTTSPPRPSPAVLGTQRGCTTPAQPCPAGTKAGDEGEVVQVQADAAPPLQDTAAARAEAVLVLLKFIIFII